MTVKSGACLPGAGGPGEALECRIVEAGDGVDEALDQLRHGGLVLTRHVRVVNLAAGRGRLLALHGPDVALTPFGLVIDPVPEVWPAADSPVRRVGERLTVGRVVVDLEAIPSSARRPLAAEPGSPARLGSRPVGPADPTLKGLRGAGETQEPFVAPGAFGCWWLETPSDGGALRIVLHRRGREAVRAMQAALRSDPPDLAGIELATRQLVGLGPGATPAGDDLVLGFLGAWQGLGSDPRGAGRVARELARHAAAATTRLAAEFYYHLARGRVSLPVRALLDASRSGQAEAVVSAAIQLHGFGATSGHDTIAGIHAYLAACGDAAHSA